MKKIGIILSMGSAVLLTGCASMVNGTTQSLMIESTPTDAKCTLQNNYGNYSAMQTPQAVMVHRSAQALQITCSTATMTGTKTVDSKTSGAVAGDFLLDFGLISGPIDAANGSLFNYPDTINVILKSVGPPNGNIYSGKRTQQ